MKPNAVTILPDADNIKSVYARTLKEERVDFICLSTGYSQVIGEWYDNVYEPKLFGSSVKTREIVADTAGNRSYGAKKDGVKNQTRYLQDAAESDLIVGDDFAAIVSFDPDSPYVVVIEDMAIVRSAQAWFDTMWLAAVR